VCVCVRECVCERGREREREKERQTDQEVKHYGAHVLVEPKGSRL
jgi:hypothetical protein